MSSENFNPFSGLITPETTDQNTSKTQINVFDQKINTLIEQVFRITVNKTPQKNKQLVYMEDVADTLTSSLPLINLDVLEQALFERILLTSPSDFLIPNDVKLADYELTIEKRVITYLYEAYLRSEKSINPQDTVIVDACKRIQELILRNISTAIKQPDLFDGQSFDVQLLDILQTPEEFQIKGKFLSAIVNEVLSDGDQNDFKLLQNLFHLILSDMKNRVQKASMITLDKWIVPVLNLFVCDKKNPILAELLLDFTTPPANSDGIIYADSLFGQLLRLSIMPKNQNGPYEYYENFMDAQSSSLNSSLWNYLKLHLDAMTDLVKGFLLIGGDTRGKMLQWIGHCLHSNVARGQIWNTHNAAGMFGNLRTGPDSFMIGLAGVLLRLCKPLLKPTFKVLLVDPTYCSVPAIDCSKKGVHMIDLEKETCLLPTEENEIRLTADTYNFVTECFFMTHKAIDLGGYLCAVTKYCCMLI